MPHGYHGQILHVDLTTGSLEIERPPDSFYRFYMGGSALGLRYLLKHTPAGADPLGPENTLVLALSVLTGAPVSGQSRVTAVAKSPLTGAVGDSQAGGFWPAQFKFSGFDALVIRGRSERPVYLWIHDGEAELRDAAHLWGRITGEVEDALREELGDEKIEVLQCGPAGEKGVRFAALINMSTRANGRTGMGAVMGSKNLKAVVVRGKLRPSLADAKALNALARRGAKELPDSMIAGLAKYGTAEIVVPQNKRGGLPSYNWDSGVFDGAEAIGGERLYDTILRERDTCYACTVRCKRVVEVTEGPYRADPRYGGPEYETLATFGSYCGVDNLEAIALANQICNQYGMDTISCGATIAWAMDCFENGLITSEDTGGLELRYGDADLIVRLTEMIGRREGFGDLLAEGSAAAARVLGRGTEELVVAVKGQEMPAHMPQVKRSLGLIYAVNPFGADHQSSEHDPPYEGGYHYYEERMKALGLTDPQPKYSLTDEKVRYALTTQYLYSCLDSINICQFVFGPAWQLYGPDDLVEMVRAVTGWDVTLDELMRVGERRLNLLRAFNAREGLGREQDRLPPKLWKALKGGPTDGFRLEPEEIERAKDVYYALAGWDVSTGVPTRARLVELGLEWVADLLAESNRPSD
ncbi:MAG TPA: aldehyde:ferredoxin oxidoreductase [Chloroflexi bacterium]|nr:aldehyde:ferredoxin oxidoreductase [Chloroflexota bacterium]